MVWVTYGSVYVTSLSGAGSTLEPLNMSPSNAMIRPAWGFLGGSGFKVTVDWVKLVRFHRTVAARAESDFFSLPAKNPNDERWTSLTDFVLDEVDGPWTISQSQVRSAGLWQQLVQNPEQTIFMGGPGYAYSQKMRNGWSPCWRPLMVREVKFSVEDQSVVVEALSDSSWSMSPLFADLLDKSAVRLDISVADLPAQLLAKAAARGGRMAVGIIDALIEMEPSLEDTLNRSSRADVVPSPWVLFRPVERFGPITANQMKDYQALEKRLERDPSDIGGMRLLAMSENTAVEPGVKALPIVPLNQSQKLAVEGALERKPITVISGPPGCGKSQVVVSLLLNAWARGLKVLFTSNNNKAVDVVRERLLHYEDNFPVAVRAGARKFANIQEVLNKTLDFAQNRDASGFDRDLVEQQRTQLEAERAGFSEDLESDVPVRIQQAWEAALGANATQRETLAEMKAAKTSLVDRLQEFGISERPGRVGDHIAATRTWLERIAHFVELVKSDSRDRRRVDGLLKTAQQSRMQAVGRVGLQASDEASWQWLAGTNGRTLMQSWHQESLAALTLEVEVGLAPCEWLEAYNDWAGEEEASQWAIDAAQLAEDIRTTATDLEPLEQDYAEKKQVENSTLARLTETGVDNGRTIAKTLRAESLHPWRMTYTEYSTLPSGFFDFLPWSQKAKLGRQLKGLEQQYRGHFPLEVWSHVGQLDQDGRARLAPIIEALRRFLEAHEERRGLETARKAAVDRISALRHRATNLRVGVPGKSLQSFLLAADNIDQRVLVAKSAAIAWSKKVKCEHSQTICRGVCAGWSSLPANPLRQAWAEGLGHELVTAIQNLNEADQPAVVSVARQLLSSGAIESLGSAWDDAHSAHGLVREHQRYLDQIPDQDQRASEWWGERPENAVCQQTRPSNWPDISTAQTKLGQLELWQKDWDEYSLQTEPRLNQRAHEEKQFADQQFQNVLLLIPDDDIVNRAQEIFSETTGPEWPVQLLQREISQFSADHIRRKIQHIDAQLEKLSFEDAKEQWLERLRENRDAVKAVGDLRQALRLGRGHLSMDDVEVYRQALELVPVWITTALSPQAIPMLPELFDLVVIDEASQCTLTGLLPLVYRGKSVVIIGDPKQLEAITEVQLAGQSAIARDIGLSADVLLSLGHAENDVYKTGETAVRALGEKVLNLTEHYRSHPAIIGFSNRFLYHKQLILKKEPTDHPDAIIPGVFIENVQQARAVRRKRSWLNEKEAAAAISLVGRLVDKLDGEQGEIGVCTPFRTQKDAIREGLQQAGYNEVLVETVHAFQGDERSVMVYSPVVADGISDGASKWVAQPPNQINVAITRAKDALYVVSDFSYCMANAHGILKELARYCTTLHDLRMESEWELELFHRMIVEGLQPVIHPKIGKNKYSFSIQSQFGQKVAIQVHEQRDDDAQAVQETALLGQGYNYVPLLERQVRDTPYECINMIREALA